MKARVALILLLLTSILVAPLLSMSQSTASEAAARTLESPLIIQTRPVLPNLAFSLNGRTFVSNREGLALILVPPGSYELSVTGRSQVGGGRRINFAGWSDGLKSPTRPVTVPKLTHLVAGFNSSSPVDLSFKDRGGRFIGGDDVDHLEFLDDRGTRISTGGAPLMLRDTRLKSIAGGFTTTPISYSVRRVTIGKLSLPASSPEFVPQRRSRVTVTLGLGADAGTTIASRADRAPFPPTEMPVRFVALAAGAATVILLLRRTHRARVVGKVHAFRGALLTTARPGARIRLRPMRHPGSRNRAPDAQRACDIRRVAQLVARFMSGQGRTFGLALGMLVFEAATAVLEAAPIAYLIDYLTRTKEVLTIPGLPSSPVATIGALTLGIILLAMVNSAADSRAEIYLSRGGRTLGFRLRTALFAHLHRLSLAYHDRRRTGDVITRVTGDVRELEEFVEKSASDIVGSFLLVIGTLLFLATQSWHVTLVAVAIIPVLSVVSRYFSTRIKTAAKKQKTREGELASSTQEMLTSIRVVQTFAGGSDAERTFGEQSGRAKEAALEAARLEAWFSWIVSVMKAVAIGAVVWIGWGLVQRDLIGVGILVMSVTLIEKMFKPTRKIIKEWNTFGKVYASAERIADVLDREATVKDKPDAVTAPRFSGRLRFDNVTFSYRVDPDDPRADNETHERRALSDVSFELLPGEVVALVGHSGAGKSSVAQLVPRLYDPQKGGVLFDERDVRDFTLDSVRSQIAVVLQDTVLFSGTVAQNISYGRTHSTLAEIEAAAKRANAHEFISQMKDGYDTELSERASNLSGGQRQRIAIARALIRQTPILILDEPTTGLDVASTDLVLGALRTLMKGKTTLLISHDLNLIRTADRILVLEAGRIVQSGSHGELLASDGPYLRLCQTQYGDLPLSGPKEETKTLSNADRPAVDLRSACPPQHPEDEDRSSSDCSERIGGASTMPEVIARTDAAVDELGPLADPPDWLIALSDPERVGRELTDRVEELRTGILLLLEIEVRRVRIKKETWTTLYHLCVAGGPYGAGSLVKVRSHLWRLSEPTAVPVRPFADEGWRCWLPGLRQEIALEPPDQALPALAELIDPEKARVLIQERIRSGSPQHSEFALESATPQIMRYKPGSRCTVLYRLGLPPGARGSGALDSVVAKTYSADKGRNAYEGMVALWDSSMRDRSAVRIAEPLAFMPDLYVLIQSSMFEEMTLKQLIRSALANGEDDLSRLKRALDKTADGLRELHESGALCGPSVTWDDELDEMQEVLERLAQPLSALDGAAQPLLARLERIARAHPPGPELPCRRSFRPAQVLLHRDDIGFIDFDGFCRAEAALDLALCYLHPAGHRPAGAVEGWGQPSGPGRDSGTLGPAR